MLHLAGEAASQQHNAAMEGQLAAFRATVAPELPRTRSTAEQPAHLIPSPDFNAPNIFTATCKHPKQALAHARLCNAHAPCAELPGRARRVGEAVSHVRNT